MVIFMIILLRLSSKVIPMCVQYRASRLREDATVTDHSLPSAHARPQLHNTRVSAPVGMCGVNGLDWSIAPCVQYTNVVSVVLCCECAGVTLSRS